MGRRPIRPGADLDFVGLEACPAHFHAVDAYLGEFYETAHATPETWREAAELLRSDLVAAGRDVRVISLQRPPMVNRATRRARTA